MKASTFKDLNVKKFLEDFVCVMIDTDQNSELAQEYGVRAIPTMFVLDSTGKKLGSFKGYRDADGFIEAVKGIKGK